MGYKKNNSAIKVAVGLSGGVDSAVSASLLCTLGFEVHGIFLKVYEDADSLLDACPWREDMKSAQEVARHLDIPLYSWNFTKEYRKTILNYFFSELKKGRTPNPDVLCNTYIKFGIFLKEAIRQGYDFVATGHYAQTLGTIDTHTILTRGVDPHKDQSYFLSHIPREHLSHIMFPVGGMTKRDVRRYARDHALPNADKKDSQGICFIGNINVSQFIRAHMPLTQGPIITINGDMVGRHNGLALYTIGQRHGINIGGTAQPYFVVEKRIVTNELVVAEGREHAALYKRSFSTETTKWIHAPASFPLSCQIQIRYRQQAVSAMVNRTQNPSCYIIETKQPLWAVTPGQFCVFYQGNVCLGSGIIT